MALTLRYIPTISSFVKNENKLFKNLIKFLSAYKQNGQIIASGLQVLKQILCIHADVYQHIWKQVDTQQLEEFLVACMNDGAEQCQFDGAYEPARDILQ